MATCTNQTAIAESFTQSNSFDCFPFLLLCSYSHVLYITSAACNSFAIGLVIPHYLAFTLELDKPVEQVRQMGQEPQPGDNGKLLKAPCSAEYSASLSCAFLLIQHSGQWC